MERQILNSDLEEIFLQIGKSLPSTILALEKINVQARINTHFKPPNDKKNYDKI